MAEGRISGKLGGEFVVAGLEGTLLKDPDPFPYFMLVAFEASGLIRFVLLLLLWPVISLLRAAGHGDLALRVMTEIATVARAVLPKFFAEDVDPGAWRLFSSRRRRAVVTALPRTMVSWFAKEHLGADEVVSAELSVNRFGIATGFLEKQADSVVSCSGSPPLDLRRTTTHSLYSEKLRPQFAAGLEEDKVAPMKPVVFHDGRLVRRPTPATALLVVLWIPLGLIVRGRPPPPATNTRSGVLFVSNHRTLMDGITISVTLGRKIPSVTYSISRLTEVISPVRLLRLSREREADAKRIKEELAKGDLIVCPEGTTCREPFLLRFSMLFAELTDRIVPWGWKGMDPIFFLMNPRPVYEVTFLDQLPPEETCAAGKRPQEVANGVQRMLADVLGFECSDYTRKDKYMLLAGNEGRTFELGTGLLDSTVDS
ncbi:unnamed protein product [Spirodela intermedia]|uniref:Phospholipid/glycerol acyltransferase domain-containing protein n=1 Tax=Spirodela intermedia TaxID=51605 RepID=A0A7I8IBR9_SPIIN|nr:unnamed protein product [Spirodela intermedia]CAA6655010.1 unnamed protein product [Spirodela intermedia]